MELVNLNFMFVHSCWGVHVGSCWVTWVQGYGYEIWQFGKLWVHWHGFMCVCFYIFCSVLMITPTMPSRKALGQQALTVSSHLQYSLYVMSVCRYVLDVPNGIHVWEVSASGTRVWYSCNIGCLSRSTCPKGCALCCFLDLLTPWSFCMGPFAYLGI